MAPEKTEIPESPAAKYAICTALDKKTTPDNFDRILKYVGRMPTEYQVLWVRSALMLNRDISTAKGFTTWVTTHQDVLM